MHTQHQVIIEHEGLANDKMPPLHLTHEVSTLQAFFTLRTFTKNVRKLNGEIPYHILGFKSYLHP